jgi:pyruvate dehydrogenase E2 component (dihydrolipoamide acetyltransferase)
MYFKPHIPGFDNLHYAYGWIVGYAKIGKSTDSIYAMGHGGGINGFNTNISRTTSNNSLVVLLNNTGRAPLNDMTKAILGIMHGKEYDMPKKSVADAILAVIGDKDTDKEAVKAALSSMSKADVKPQAIKETAPVVSTPEAIAVPKPAPVAQAPKVNSNTSGRIVASPLAKKLAEEKGINLNNVAGSGEGGRIIKRDIENFNAPAASVQSFVPAGVEGVTEIANSSIRKVIAKRLSASKFSAPHYYLGVEFDMDNAIAFRQQYNTIPETKISFNDIIVKALALALKQHPQVNSQWFEDKIIQNHHVHVGVAVAVEDGLIVPVLKFTDEMDLRQIGATVKDFAGRARAKKLTPTEIEGSTFTISNLGMFGIQEFTSIINQPNSAILSVGAIVNKPVVKEGQIVVGNTMKLTLACDHRTVDGATGSLFLQTLKSYIENPITLLVS